MLKTLTYAGAALPALIGYLVLTGWAFDIAALKNLAPGSAAMNPTAAFVFILAGVSLFLLNAWPSIRSARSAAMGSALCAILTGGLNLAGYFLQWETGIDQLLFQSKLIQEALPSRMTPASSLNFFLLGTALILLQFELSRRLRLAQILALTAAALSLLDLSTAFLFLLLALGILTILPDGERTDAAGENQESRTAQPPRNTETILVVDDDEAIQKLIHRVLAPEGYTILQARNPPEALEICHTHPTPIHLLLSDSVLPQMPGRKLTELLLTLRPEMKAICMSGRMPEEGDRHFLQKPFLPDFLCLKVREVLDGPKSLRPKDLPALP